MIRFTSYKRSRTLWLFATMLVLLIAAISVSAQQAPAPIAIGQNQTGTLTQAQPTVSFALLVDQPQTINVRVFAVSPGLAPTVRLVDTNGNVLGTAPNNGTQTAVQIQNVNAALGVYRVEVSSANGQLGDFLVNVQGETQQPPIQLPLGQIVNGTVNSSATRLAYSFSGAPDQGRWLFVQSLLPTSGPVVTLFDGANQQLATSGAQLRGARYLLPASSNTYTAEITYGGSGQNEAFLICVAQENNAASCPVSGNTSAPQQVVVPTEVIVPTLAPTMLPPLPASNVCILGSATGINVNVRSGPSTTFPVVTQLNSTTYANVIGRLPDGSWYLIQVSGITGWISSTVVRLGGPCQLVPNVTPTPMGPTATFPGPTLTFTPTPTVTITPTPTNTTAPTGTLNYSLPPNYGSTALISGFVPDPFTVGITSGGSVNVSYLGGGCTGFATAAPDFSVNYTSGAFPTLRFYFVGSGDSTMIINAPNGSYYCNDDSFGTLNPSIDFNTPSSGRYDVWIGSYSSGTFISGTLSVTESTGNHP